MRREGATPGFSCATALLAVPLLIIMKTIFSAAGTPDIAGFLFEHGTLTHAGEEETEKDSTDVDTPRAAT